MKEEKKTDLYFVASYPKSGATWFQFLIYVCVHGKLDRSLQVRRYYPHWSNDKVVKPRLEKPERLFVKSHMPYSADMRLKERITTCIYLCRNPMDIVASKLNHYILHGNPDVETEKGREKFIARTIQHANAKPHEVEVKDTAGGWNNHVVSWIEENNDIPVYIIQYEDLRENTYEALRRMNRDLNLGFHDKSMHLAAILASFENLRALEKHEVENQIIGSFYSKKRIEAFTSKNVQFINKGVVGNYKSTLTEEQMDDAIKSYQQGLNILKYRYDDKRDLIR